MRTIVIIAAGGVGSRMNAGINKVLLTLDGKTVFRGVSKGARASHEQSVLLHVMTNCFTLEIRSRLNSHF